MTVPQSQTTTLRRSSIGIPILLGLWLGASNAAAQESAPPTWKNDFDEVDVQVVNPEDLPGAEESIMPAALTAKSALPRATSFETLRKASAEISDRVFEVIVIPRDNSPVRQTQIVVRGEAVWLSGKPGQADPVLVTNAHYLYEAEAVFIKRPEKRRSDSLPTVQRRNVNQMSLGADVKALLKDPDLVRVTVANVDKHRNLATLTPPADFDAPARGLEFFPIDEEAASSAYGFSHQMGSTLVLTKFLAPSKKRDELQFYLHTTFPVILGAPIVSDDGRVIAVTAARHPSERDRTLVIPPRALRHFVAKAQGIDVTAPDDKKK